MIAVVIWAIGVSLLAALLTYHPNDSSAFFTSTNTIIANAIGYYGATIAWIFVGFFGFASLLFPGALFGLGWNRFSGKDLEYLHTKVIGFVLLVIALPALFDLAIGKFWFRGALIPAGGYLGQEIGRTMRGNLNTSGAAIALITMLLIGVLLSTRISLAAVFVSTQRMLVDFGRTIALHWARLSERRRKEKMKDALVRKHLEKIEAPAPLRLVTNDEPSPAGAGPIVREVKGAGRFQIRKVTKADLRKAAEALSQQVTPDPFALYARAPEPIEELDEPIDFEDPLYLDDEPPSAPPPARPKPQIPRPAARRPQPSTRSSRLTHDLLPTVNLLQPGPKQDTINDEVHKKFLEIGHLIEDRCREFSVEGEVTAYHPGPVVTTFEFKPSAGVKYAKVVNLGDDLALALKAESIRIERISGSSTVGIEVPNRKRELITLRDIIDSEAFTASQSMLTLALGKDIHGDAFVTDLSRMPHLLVAGATGAGKSVGLNSMIVSLL